jgi:hypothetical protein
MALLRAAVAFFSDSTNLFSNLKPRLLLLGGPFCNSHFPIIFVYFEKIDIVVDSNDVVGKDIFFAVGIF